MTTGYKKHISGLPNQIPQLLEIIKYNFPSDAIVRIELEKLESGIVVVTGQQIKQKSFL